MIQTEIISYSNSALDVRLPYERIDEYLRSYSMPTVGMLKVVNYRVRMRKH